MKKSYIFLILIFVFLKNQTILAQYLLLSQPIYQAVYQRDNANTANIPISGQIVGNSISGSFKIEAITNLLDANGTIVPLTTNTTLITNSTSRGVFNGTINRSKGWYSVQIKFTALSNGAVSTSTTKCGVGDVFIIAGQSNAQGDNGATPTVTTIPEWIVGNNEDWNCRKEFEQRPTMTKIDGANRIGPSGNNAWCYGVLGKKISDANGGMPVAFFNSAAGGSSVKNWRDGANGFSTAGYFNLTGQWCDGYVSGQPTSYYVGQPYLTLKNVLNWYVPLFGVRAVLWHQGEADALNTYDPNVQLTRNAATYTTYLNEVITRSRTDLGNTNLSWMIAQVSYSSDNTTGGTLTPNYNATSARNGQSGSTNGTTIRLGPLTDRYNNLSTGTYRYDNTHFSESFSGGLTVLSTLWNSLIDNSSSTITAFNRIPSTSVPTVSISQSGSNYTFSVSAGSTAYCWASGSTYAPPLSGCLSTSNNYTSSSTSAVRCFIKNGNNWQSTAQVIPFSCSGCREGVENSDDIDNTINMKVYPNPSDKDFRVEFDVLEDDTHVKLEFFDMAGRSVKVVADGSHAKGHFNYPITEPLPAGASICQLKVGEIFISKKVMKVN